MRRGGEAMLAKRLGPPTGRWLRATAGGFGLLAVLCACAPARPTPEASQRLSALPTLTVHRQLIAAAAIAFHASKASRPSERPTVQMPTRWDFSEPGEIIHVLAGAMTAREGDGEPVEVTAGDVAVYPIGWSGVWKVTQTLTKFYVIYR